MNHQLITIQSPFAHHFSGLYHHPPFPIHPIGPHLSSRTKAQGVKRFPVSDSTVALFAKLATSAASTQPGAIGDAKRWRKRGVHQQNFLNCDTFCDLGSGGM